MTNLSLNLPTTHAGPGEKLPLTVALIGAPGAGKSALAGHLQFCTGNLPAATVAAFERTAHGAVHGGAIPASKVLDTFAQLPPVLAHPTTRRSSTKALAPKLDTTTATSFQYAWLHDRARGADWAPTTLASTRYHVRVLDTRGTCAAMAATTAALVRADLLVLVVSAVPSEWARSMGTVAPAAPSTMAAPMTPTSPQVEENTGMGEGGEARYLLMVAYAMGVRQVLVAVNKMDQVQWAGDRFTAVVKDTSSILKKIGFNVKAVAFVPVAAIAGDGIMDPPPAARAPWYLGWRRDGKLGEKTGNSLMQAIDASNPPRKLLDRALRATVLEIHPPIHHTVHADGGTTRGGPLIVGRIEAGALRVGLDVRLAPTLLRATIRSCHSGPNPSATAPVPNPGSTVAFVLDGIFPDEIHVGDVIGAAPSNSTTSKHLPPSSAAAPDLPPVTRPWSSSSPPPSPTRATTSRKSGGAGGANDTADPARPAAAMTLVILVLADHARVLAPGWTPTLAVHAAQVKVKVTDLVGKVDRRSGQVIEDRPRNLHPGDAAVVRCVPLAPVCVEPVADVPSMARIVLLDAVEEVGAVGRAESAPVGRVVEGSKKGTGRERPVAVGVIKSVDKYDDDGKVFTCPRKRSV
ncbi:translation elongation factor EF-1 alpha [Allomyces javanicus]|nr:translation elongation factor EF-1 alpha [Allomyces javanicus]